MLQKLKRCIFKHYRDNIFTYFIIIIILAIGIIIGSITTKILEIEKSNEIMMFLNSFLKFIDNNNLDNFLILKQSIFDNFKSVLLILCSGIIYIGIIVIPILILLRGFTLGFTVGFFVNQYGLKGFFFSILGIFSQNIFIIPGIISIASIGMAYSLNIIKKRKLGIRNSMNINTIIDYSTLILLFSIFIFIGCLIEAYLTPVFLKLLIDYLI